MMFMEFNQNLWIFRKSGEWKNHVKFMESLAGPGTARGTQQTRVGIGENRIINGKQSQFIR